MNVQRVQCFSVSGDDKPGAWANLLNTCKSESVDLAGIWGWGMEGKASFMVAPQNPATFKEAMNKSGFRYEESACFFVSVTDQLGAFCEIANTIAEAGINLLAADAIGVEGKVGAYLWCNEADVEKLAGVLGA